jgi:hypothetical protein
MGLRKRVPFEVVYEDSRAVYAFRDSVTVPTEDTFEFRALWSETLRLLVVERFFPEEDEPALTEITSFDNVCTRGDAVRISVKYADFEAERQLYNAGRTGPERLRALDFELEDLCGRFLLPALHEQLVSMPNDDGSTSVH